MKHTYTVTGMTCNGCRNSVETKLATLTHVTNVSVNLEEEIAVIESSKTISIEVLQKVLPEKFTISKAKKATNITPKSNDAEVQKSELQQLKPLFLIFTYILLIAIGLHYKNWNWSGFMLDFMGIFYIVFSFFKVLDLKGFPESFKMYDPLAKKVSAYAVIYPFIEIALGLLFLFRIQIPLALVLTILILGITTIGVTQSLLSKRAIQCACLGTALKLPMTKATFIENTIMIVMAVIMLTKQFL